MELKRIRQLISSNVLGKEDNQTLKELLDLATSLEAIENSGLVVEEKEELETCTKCGGIGSVPNHPYIKAHTCDKCNGGGKVIRLDYKAHNEARQQSIKLLAKNFTVEKMEIIIAQTHYDLPKQNFLAIKTIALKGKHFGDCTKEPEPCAVCQYKEINDFATTLHKEMMGSV